jgi:hypothetical protein
VEGINASAQHRARSPPSVVSLACLTFCACQLPPLSGSTVHLFVGYDFIANCPILKRISKASLVTGMLPFHGLIEVHDINFTEMILSYTAHCSFLAGHIYRVLSVAALFTEFIQYSLFAA